MIEIPKGKIRSTKRLNDDLLMEVDL